MTVVPAERGPQYLGITGFFLALSTITIFARCYCRMILVRSFGLDDAAVFVAWVFFVFYSCFAITGVYHGTGQHTGNLPPTEIPVGLKWWWACEPAYVLSNMALKLSIGIMLLRLAVERTHRVIIWIVLGVIETYGIGFLLLFILQCRPSAYFWTRYTGGEGTCINPSITVTATYVTSAISCATDWTLAIIPIFILRNIQMNPRIKLVVGLILAMGAIASTATIIRIPYLHDLEDVADFLYATTDIAIWSTIETGIGIAACCMATLRPLFRTFFARSRLVGNSSSVGSSKGWRRSIAQGQGYIRSGNLGDKEPIHLRSDLGQGTNTVIEVGSTGDLERGEREGRISGGSKLRWNDSEDELVAGKEKIQGGILKTTISTMTEERRL